MHHVIEWLATPEGRRFMAELKYLVETFESACAHLDSAAHFAHDTVKVEQEMEATYGRYRTEQPLP